MTDDANGNLPQSPPTAQSKPRTRRRWLFVGIICLLTLVLCEGLSRVYLSAMDSFGLSLLKSHQQALATGGSDDSTRNESLHPYVGWVQNPDVHPGIRINETLVTPNRWGFIGNDDEIIHRKEGDVVIGIAGGSVAWQMSLYADETFRRVLLADERFADKNIRLVRMALPGFKQPQQQMTLNYFLALGFEFDAVINLDGYNEAGLTPCENYHAGVALIYPRAWHASMQDIVDPREYVVSQDLLEIRAARQRLARNIQSSPLHWSALRNLIWHLRDEHLRSQMIEMALGLKEREQRHGRGYAADGPADDSLEDAAMEAEVVGIWRRASEQMDRLCAGNGMRYVHCLQPNQYLEGSKPLSQTERDVYFDPRQCAGKFVNKLYPQMIAAGEQMRDEGIAFHDLTQLFGQIEETIYTDYCCHYNERGNELLAEEVAARLLESW